MNFIPCFPQTGSIPCHLLFVMTESHPSAVCHLWVPGPSSSANVPRTHLLGMVGYCGDRSLVPWRLGSRRQGSVLALHPAWSGLS